MAGPTDRTGLGEALTGTLVLGLITALPSLAASVAAALDRGPAMAILLNVIIRIALVYGQKRGSANIRFPSVSMLFVYAAGFLTLTLLT